jgi:broad specificity phosphatase PhoE
VTRIWLARHGETDDNIEPIRIQGRIDTPLNDTGRAQAHELAERVVAEGGVRGIWSSQLSRARETAEIVGARVGLEPAIDPRLAEGNRGRLEGRLWEEVARSEPNTYAAWRAAGEEFRFPEGESLLEQQTRVLASLSEIRAAGPGPCLVVCHGGSIRVVLCAGDPRGLRAFHSFDIPNVALIRL